MKLPMPFDNPQLDSYADHTGMDFGQSIGTPIPASDDGVVTARFYKDRPGYTVFIKYDSIPPEVGYAHMVSLEGVPPVGARVSYGQTIGYVGNTGNSTGPHAHSEVEGYETTAGYLQWFDKNRSVAGGGGGGGGAMAPNQRRATSGGTRGRAAATTASAEVTFLNEGEVGTFSGYVLGEMINGINGWAVGAYSGAYFWMGGLEPLTIDGLPNLSTPEPTPPAIGPQQRVATAGGTRGREAPTTQSAQIAFLDEGEVGDFNGWRNGEVVDGEGRWLRGAHSGSWFWLGGLSPQNVDGLADLNGTPEPEPNPDPSDGRVIYPKPEFPSYPEAVRWAHSSKCDPRKAGSEIQLLILHGWGKFPNSAESEWNYFTGWQGPDEGSSPTWQVNADGSVYEVVPPDVFRPWTTGSIDHRAVTIEAQPISGNVSGNNKNPQTDWLYSAAQHERFAQLLAFAHKRWGVPLQVAELSGTGKDTKIIRGGLTQHNLTPAGEESKTVCPGPSVNLDTIVARAKTIANPPKPDPGPDPIPSAGLAPSREWWQQLSNLLGEVKEHVDELLEEG